jgi:CubicO group peptidase (beta-lactamase class C family)
MSEPPAVPPDTHRARIESAILEEVILRSEEPATLPLTDLMAKHNVPGVSIAVIHAGALEWTRGYGVREAGQPDPVTPDTLFQVCSISKPVTALAVLRLVQEGRLDLDEDVNRYLTSWRVPANGDWQPRVTLRHLMSHGAGLSQHGFPGYNRRDPLPTVPQVLDGVPPANTGPVRVNAIPGTQFRYSGGGTTIVQQLLMDMIGLPFAHLMRELVLDPLGMRHSTYAQPLPEARWAQAATAHRTGGAPVDGQWHVYPEQAAAGLWTTPADLARVALDIQRARAGAPGTFLGKPIVDEMLTYQAEEVMGLGFFLDGKGATLRFSHGGDNEGFKALFVAYAERGQGAIIATNGDMGWILCDGIARTIAREYGWPDYTPPTPEPVALAPEQVAACVGRYKLKPGWNLIVTQRPGGGLLLQPQDQAPFALYPTSDRTFFARAVDVEVTFDREGDMVTGLSLTQNGKELAANKTG